MWSPQKATVFKNLIMTCMQSHVHEYCAISSNIEQIVIIIFKCLTIAVNSIGLCTIP